MTSKAIAELRTLDNQTLGRFIGIAQMLQDKLTTSEYALHRIVEIYSEYEKKRLQVCSTEES